jgi:hypothetical protein
LSPTPTSVVAFVARSIRVTSSSAALATYAVLPSGVIAIAWGSLPTGIVAPATRVATSTARTWSAPVSTT